MTVAAEDLDDGSDHLEALQAIFHNLSTPSSSNPDAVWQGLQDLKPIAKDLNARRQAECRADVSQAHDTPWNVLCDSQVLLTVVDLYVSPPTAAIRNATSPLLASWCRALSHSRDSRSGDLLMTKLKPLTETMLHYLEKEPPAKLRFGDNDDLTLVIRDAQVALHMMTTNSERALRVIESLKAVDVLADFLKRTSALPEQQHQVTLSASIALGQLVAREADTTRVATITADAHVADTLVTALTRLLDGDTTLGFYTLAGLMIAASCLAANDDNKRLFVQAGMIPIVVRVLTGQHDAQIYSPVQSRCYAAEMVWNLAFLHDLQTPIQNAGIVPLLQILQNSDASTDKERYYATGALFQLLGGTAAAAAQQETKSEEGDTAMAVAAEQDGSKKEEEEAQQQQQEKKQKKTVMLSYNWGVQETVVQIKHALQSQGFDVWIDVEQMSGSTLQAMAHAVERAHVVVMCVSRKYQDSPACRTEAEYAYALQKTTIPLMFEQQPWRATGWLGAHLGTKLWYDFSNRQQFDASLSNLVRELKTQMGEQTPTPTTPAAAAPAPKDDDDKDPAPSPPPSAAANNHQPSIMAAKKVSKMTVDAVQTWLRDIGSETEFGSAFRREKVSGRSLVELCRLRNQPETAELYYQFLLTAILRNRNNNDDHAANGDSGTVGLQLRGIGGSSSSSVATGQILEFSAHLQELFQNY